MKLCGRCGKRKGREQFRQLKSSKDGLYSYCRECHNANSRAAYAHNREERLARQRVYVERNRERINKRERERKRQQRGSEAKPTLASRLRETQAHGDCKLWTGSLDPKGYGRWGEKTAHRAVAEAGGVTPPPEGFNFHHKCGNRGCVNLAHLQIVTVAEHIALHKQEVATNG